MPITLILVTSTLIQRTLLSWDPIEIDPPTFPLFLSLLPRHLLAVRETLRYCQLKERLMTERECQHAHRGASDKTGACVSGRGITSVLVSMRREGFEFQAGIVPRSVQEGCSGPPLAWFYCGLLKGNPEYAGKVIEVFASQAPCPSWTLARPDAP